MCSSNELFDFYLLYYMSSREWKVFFFLKLQKIKPYTYMHGTMITRLLILTTNIIMLNTVDIQFLIKQ